MSSPLRKSSFVGGEWAPALHARVDLEAYRSALKTCRNFTVRPQGGVRNRPGTQLVDRVMPATPVIPTANDILALSPDIWLDAQTLVGYSNADPVVLWPGLDAAMRDFVDHPVAGNATYSTVEFPINGKPALFAGTSAGAMMCLSSTPGTNRTYAGEYTVAIVFRAGSSGAPAQFHAFGRWPNSFTNEGVSFPSAINPYRIEVRYAGTAFALTGTVTYDVGSPHYAIIRRDASLVHRVWLDGVEISLGSPLTQAGTLTVGAIFGLSQGAFAESSNSIGEFMVFPSSLSAGDIANLNTYLAEHWAFQAASNPAGGGTTTVASRVTLVPFVFNQDEAYVLEFGTDYIRFVMNGARVLVTDASPTVATNDKDPPDTFVTLGSDQTASSIYRAQGFISTSPIAFSIGEIRLKMKRTGGEGPLTSVAIYADAAGLPGTAIAGLDFANFTDIESASLTSDYAFVSFVLRNPLAAPVTLSPTTLYHLVIRGNDSAAFTGEIGIAATTGDAYTSGQVDAFAFGSWSPSHASLAAIDLCFEIGKLVVVGSTVEVATTYTEEEAREIKGRTAQSADVLFIPHHLHAPAELRRHAETLWELTDLANAPGSPAPASPTVTGDTVGSAFNPAKQWLYVVTSIDAVTGNESFGSIPKLAIINVTSINPATVTVGAINGASGYNVYRGRNNGIYGFIGTFSGTQFFDDGQAPDYTLTPILDPADIAAPPTTPAPGTPTVFTHPPSDLMQGTWWWAVTAVIAAVESSASGAVSAYAHALTIGNPTTVTIPAVVGATSYNVYRGRDSNFLGRIGTTATTTFQDTGTAPNYAIQAPLFVPNQPPGTPPITFDDEGDFPSVAAFIDQRLMFAGTDNKPDTIFGSRVGNYRNFNASSPAGDDDAFEFTLAALTVDRIRGLIHSRTLMCFTGSSEYIIKGSRDSEIGPSSIDVKAHAHFGSGALAPLAVGGRVLFSQLEGKAVREFRFDFQQDGYTAEDERSVLAKHLLDGHSIVDWAYAKGPDSIVWAVRDDGILLGMTYLPQHDVIAWHQHDTDGLVESVACIPEGDETAVYISVARMVGGETVRFIERFASRQIDDPADGVFLDCSLTYRSPDMSTRVLTFSAVSSWLADGTATATITGQDYFVAVHVGSQLVLHDAAGNEYRATITAVTNGLVVTVKFVRDFSVEMQAPTMSFTHALKVFQFAHMIGETVSALVDGNVVPDLVVDSAGDVTLPFAGATVTIGKPYVSEIETLDINIDGRSMQTVRKVIGKAWVEFVASRGLWVGEPGGKMTEWKQRRVADGSPNAGAATPVFTGRDYVAISGGWGTNGRVLVQQRDPLPCEITSLTPEVTFGG